MILQVSKGPGLQESPAGRPSFSQIVKVLKDMATALRPRKPRPPGTSSSVRSSRLPSAVLPQPSIPEHPTPSEPATAREPQPPQPVSQPTAETRTAEAKAGAESKAEPSPEGRAASEAHSPAGQSPAGGMQNPFAAQAQKNPMEKPSQGLSSNSRPVETKDSNIGETLASAKQPETLQNPFKEGGKPHDLPEGPSAEGSQGQAALSLGSTVEAESESSIKSHPKSTASKAAGERQGSEPTTPQHKPAVSAFTAVAGQPGD